MEIFMSQKLKTQQKNVEQKVFSVKAQNSLEPSGDFQSSDPTAEGLKLETQAGRNLPHQNVKFRSAEKIFKNIFKNQQH